MRFLWHNKLLFIHSKTKKCNFIHFVKKCRNSVSESFEILPEFSTNQNFCVCTYPPFTPNSYATAESVLNVSCNGFGSWTCPDMQENNHTTNYMWNVFNPKLICARNRAGWAINPDGLSPTLCGSNMLEHINLLNRKILVFLYAHQHAINSWFLMLLFFFLFHLCCFVIWAI